LPHIVFNNKIDLESFSKKFVPIFQKIPILIRVSTVFVDKNKVKALLPAVSISDVNQQFLIEISTQKSKTTIKLYSGTDPEKTDGVKMSMALLAEQIMHHYSKFKVTKTNLEDYLGMVVKH